MKLLLLLSVGFIVTINGLSFLPAAPMNGFDYGGSLDRAEVGNIADRADGGGLHFSLRDLAKTSNSPSKFNANVGMGKIVALFDRGYRRVLQGSLPPAALEAETRDPGLGNTGKERTSDGAERNGAQVRLPFKLLANTHTGDMGGGDIGALQDADARDHDLSNAGEERSSVDGTERNTAQELLPSELEVNTRSEELGVSLDRRDEGISSKGGDGAGLQGSVPTFTLEAEARDQNFANAEEESGSVEAKMWDGGKEVSPNAGREQGDEKDSLAERISSVISLLDLAISIMQRP